METKNSTYLILAIILLILSAIGVYFLFFQFQNLQQSPQSSSYNSNTVPKIEMIPTDIPDGGETIITPEISESTISAQATISPVATNSTTKTTPTTKPTATVIPTKITPTKSVLPTSSATEEFLNYSSSSDGFSVSYSSARKLVQDTEATGNRYTFTSSLGNFAVHVSPAATWAWMHSNRQFSQNFTVSGQPTFRYDINFQTIVDLKSSDKNYTIQCVHNGHDSLKAECETFLASFRLL